MSHSLATNFPDLIVLYPGSGDLNVYAYCIGLRLKTVLWRERVTCSSSVDLAGDLSPVLARHALRVETPTALVADPASGGFLLVPGPGKAHRDPLWVARQLDRALPYPPRELRWRTRAGTTHVEIFWLPQSWVNCQAEALAKLGLCLTEIFPRAALWRNEAMQSVATQPCLLEEADAWHVFEEGLVLRSAPLPAETQAAAQAQKLERLALGTTMSSVVRKIPAESEEALARRVLALWLDGSDAIYLAAGRWASWAPWQPVLALSAACAALLAIAAIGLSAQNTAMENALDGLTRDQRALAPVEQKFMEMQRSLRSDRKYLAAAKVLDGTAPPLDALNRISAALPDKYWIQHLQFKGDTIELAGRGGGDQDVIRLFAKKGLEASAISENLPRSADKSVVDGFNIRLAVNQPAGGGGR